MWLRQLALLVATTSLLEGMLVPSQVLMQRTPRQNPPSTLRASSASSSDHARDRTDDALPPADKTSSKPPQNKRRQVNTATEGAPLAQLAAQDSAEKKMARLALLGYTRPVHSSSALRSSSSSSSSPATPSPLSSLGRRLQGHTGTTPNVHWRAVTMDELPPFFSSWSFLRCYRNSQYSSVFFLTHAPS
mmetsp:Transcript_438/g.973  ORF Transcript_438/g.973 Transcript_438/m.973 type:complete len:189 (+) Transcript_438:15-581(+)